MTGPVFAAVVIVATLALAFVGDVIAQRGLPDFHGRRFDRMFERNLAARAGASRSAQHGRHERR
jgi:hypothetical protein